MPILLYTLFAMMFMPLILTWVNVYFRYKDFGAVDNNNPRHQVSQQTGTGARVQAAQANTWEALIIYSITCFLAFASGADLHQFDDVALVYLGLRIAYVGFYIINKATLRSLTFVANMACCIYIVVQSIN
jgi:uncharacterized MAPEG superfamily protein